MFSGLTWSVCDKVTFTVNVSRYLIRRSSRICTDWVADPSQRFVKLQNLAYESFVWLGGIEEADSSHCLKLRNIWFEFSREAPKVEASESFVWINGIKQVIRVMLWGSETRHFSIPYRTWWFWTADARQWLRLRNLSTSEPFVWVDGVELLIQDNVWSFETCQLLNPSFDWTVSSSWCETLFEASKLNLWTPRLVGR